MKIIIAVFISACLLYTLPLAAQEQTSSLPGGVIVMWSGALDKVPAGWALCDSENGTPDLSNRFVMGVGAEEYMGTSGGSPSHRHHSGNHSHQIDPPAMSLRPSYGYSGYRSGSARNRFYTLPERSLNLRPFKSGPAHTTRDTVSHLPPYLKIAFIMKL